MPYKTLTLPDFEYVCRLARDEAAIVLERGKEYLVQTRLGALAQREGFASLTEFIGRLRTSAKVNGLHHKAIDALTTNETLFFRDHHPFEGLRTKILPALLAKRAASKCLNIWSAACATGQEPYSLALLLREHFPQLADWKVSILGTDLSPTVLARAREGDYSQHEVNRGLPAIYLVKYFTQHGDRWRLKDEIKRWVHFREMNLVQTWPELPRFDLVLLRNVMIYFDVPTKQGILKKVRSRLEPHGFLFLGTAETTMNLDSGFEPLNHERFVAYRLKPDFGA